MVIRNWIWNTFIVPFLAPYLTRMENGYRDYYKEKLKAYEEQHQEQNAGQAGSLAALRESVRQQNAMLEGGIAHEKSEAIFRAKCLAVLEQIADALNEKRGPSEARAMDRGSSHGSESVSGCDNSSGTPKDEILHL